MLTTENDTDCLAFYQVVINWNVFFHEAKLKNIKISRALFRKQLIFLCINPNGKSIIFTIHKLVNNTITWVYFDPFGCCLDPNIKCCMGRFYFFGLKLTWVLRLFVFGKKKNHLRTFHILFIGILLIYFNFCISKIMSWVTDEEYLQVYVVNFQSDDHFFPSTSIWNHLDLQIMKGQWIVLSIYTNLVLKVNFWQNSSHLNKNVIFLAF